MEMQLDKQTLTVVVRNSEPVELSVFAQSMMSLADDYESMCGSAGSHARLYIKEIRQGSIIAELAPSCLWRVRFLKARGRYWRTPRILLRLPIG